MKKIKNYETHINVPKHVNIEKKNDNLIFKGPLGITLINLALHDKNGHSQLSLLLSQEKSIIFFKSCNKAFFKCMVNIIKDKMHLVLNGFLLSMNVRGVGYRVEIQNHEFSTESPFKENHNNNKLFSLNGNNLLPISLNYNKAYFLSSSEKNRHREIYCVKNPISFNRQNMAFLPEQSKNQVFRNKQSFLGREHTHVQNTQIQTLFFKIGFSHDFKYICPSSVRIFTKTQTLICIYGIDRNQVSTIAAKIHTIKKPSVYKGKGIIFLNEKITLKQGKRK